MKKAAIIISILILIAFGCARRQPTASGAASPTKTATHLDTPSITSTFTFSPTITVTETVTKTHTSTNTFTVTDTHTVTATLTISPTISSTFTCTITPTIMPTVIYSDLVNVPGDTIGQSNGAYGFSHTISAFKIGKYEVTYELWNTVYQWAIVNGYTFQNAGTEGNDGIAGALPTSALHEPVTTINWRDVIIWCNAYSQMTGLTPVYCLDPGFIVPIKDSIDGAYSSSINNAAGSFDNPYVNWNANGFRLPTEGEWQFAASYIDGTNWYMYNYASGATANYNDAAATGLVAWYSANTTVPHNVGEKNPDALGIYDMSGNVMEWCWDWSNTYPTSAQTDYRGPDNGDGREIRGGYYNNSSASYLQIGFRQPYNPYQEYYGLGFRLAKTY